MNWVGLGSSIFSTAGHSIIWNGDRWVEGGQGGHYQDVRWKYISGTNYELWVSAGNFNNIAPFVKAKMKNNGII